MKTRYYNKLKLLLMIVVFIPTVAISVGIFLIFSKHFNFNIKLPYLFCVVLVESLIALYMSNRLSGLFDEEALMIQSNKENESDDWVLVNKIQKLSSANEKLNILLQAILEQESAYQNDCAQYELLYNEQIDKREITEHDITLQMKIDLSLMELTSQFLIQIDVTGKILQINKAFCLRLGYIEEDLIGKNIIELIKNDDEVIVRMTASKLFSKSEEYENQVKMEWLEKINKAQTEPIFISMQMKASNPNASEHISIKSILLKDGTLLCVGKAINDEISLQSNILRKNRELEYINQINASLISNWDIEALLDNIIKRIGTLFNIKLGGIYVLNDSKEWQLKSYASKTLKYEEVVLIDVAQYFTDDLIKNPLIKTIETKDAELNYLILSPLEVDSEIIAIMAIAMNQEMNANDINILKMFKNQASMVIQRAIIYDQLRKQYFGTVEALVNVIEAKDKYTEGHSRRVSRFAVEIAKEMDYSNEEIENIEIAGLLHDVGKIGIDQSILAKRGRLTDYEYEVIKEHPTKGIQILEAISFDEKIKNGILYHHIRYDLSGYPKADIEIQPEYACVIGIADAFDAITSARSYSNARTKDEALTELIKYEGTQFDPILVQVFKKLITENPDKVQDIIDDIEVAHLE